MSALKQFAIDHACKQNHNLPTRSFKVIDLEKRPSAAPDSNKNTYNKPINVNEYNEWCMET